MIIAKQEGLKGVILGFYFNTQSEKLGVGSIQQIDLSIGCVSLDHKKTLNKGFLRLILG